MAGSSFGYTNSAPFFGRGQFVFTEHLTRAQAAVIIPVLVEMYVPFTVEYAPISGNVMVTMNEGCREDYKRALLGRRK